jgi:hypothetical protein
VVAFGRLSRKSGRKGETGRVEAKPETESRRSGLVRALPPAEERYRQHLKTIEERRHELVKLENDLVMLRDAVTGFEAIAQSRLGDLFAQLRRLESQTGDYSHRLARLRAALDALELDELEDDEPEDEEELLAEAAFAAASGRARPRGPHVPAATRRWLATEAAEAKRLYIDLAKRLHPDLARDDEERQRRERIMQRVNEAFHLRDLAGLRALHLESIADDPNWAERPVTDRLAWAEAELTRLEAALKETRLALTRLRSGELFRLYLRYESGDPVFADLQKRVEERITNETRRLEKMQASYRRLVDRWRLAGTASS